MHLQGTFWEKEESKGTPLEPRQGRTPAPPMNSVAFALYGCRLEYQLWALIIMLVPMALFMSMPLTLAAIPLSMSLPLAAIALSMPLTLTALALFIFLLVINMNSA